MTNLQISRRRLLPAAAAGGIAALSRPSRAAAATYPSQPINFTIPYTPGGTYDSYARKFCQFLHNDLPNNPNVEPVNQPGAGGRKAIFSLLALPPDGYNISMIALPGILQNKYAAKGPKVALDQITWVANLGRDSYGVAVGKNSPIKNIADLKKLAKTRPITFASSGPGSDDYFATHVFGAALNLPVKLVSGYTGSVATAVAAARGDVDCVAHPQALLQEMRDSGLVRIIFVFAEKSPYPGIDDSSSVGVPDLAEVFQFFPVAAPPGLPQPILSLLSGTLVKEASSDAAKAWAKGLGTTLHPLDHQQTLQTVRQQMALVDKWKDAIKS